MRKICCFAGHGRINYDEKIHNAVYQKCIELITVFGVNEFWVGQYGGFDSLAAYTVRSIKETYSNIELNLVIPYLTNAIIENKELYYERYNNILMSDIPENTPIRYRILKCNQYIIYNSSYLIAYVDLECGGAFQTLKYAKRQNHIQIFNFGSCK